MRLETIPLILGILVALPGLALIADAWMPDGTFVPTERRRRDRAERHRVGEAIVGVGILCLAAALMGRDVWRYATVAVLAGVVCVIVGTVMNWRLIRESVTFRGAARRGHGGMARPGTEGGQPAASKRIPPA